VVVCLAVHCPKRSTELNIGAIYVQISRDDKNYENYTKLLAEDMFSASNSDGKQKHQLDQPYKWMNANVTDFIDLPEGYELWQVRGIDKRIWHMVYGMFPIH